MWTFFLGRDAITFAIACIGAVLGILNTWRAIDKERPKLKVIPKQAYMMMDGHIERTPRLCIEVTNLSSFPLTVSEVGVLLKGTSERAVILQPMLNNGASLPYRLDPRTSLSTYAAPDALADTRHPVKCAYVRTDCGLTFKGDSRALRQLAAS